jgi:mono/diheme cytochrome c family protein
LGSAALAADEKPRVDFARDVRPIFQARCYQCHDGRKHTSGLRLDVRSIALRGGDSGKPAVVPGHSATSALMRRVTSTDKSEAMPPKGQRLSAEQIRLLRAWIDAGAVWPDALAGEDKAGHWAFRPPVRPPLPAVKDERWPRNAIDRFILARLEKERLRPSPEADRTTLIRRLYLDLIGLPPSIAEVDAFLADRSEAAYEKVVDRLLSSPHYGERWGRHWLDAARYADSDGFEKDKPRQVWFYRDWVIHALNRDLPYDQFIIEQVGGALLAFRAPSFTFRAQSAQRARNVNESSIATGYLRNSMINEEGGIDPEQFRMEAMFDRMDAIGKGVLGLTIQCCQCHNHKYDPMTQAEYYRMFAFLNNAHEATAAAYTPADQMKRAEIFRQVRAAENDLRHRHPDWRRRMYAWEDKVKNDQLEWTVVRPDVDNETDGGQKILPLEDGSFLAQGYAPTKHTLKMAVRTGAKDITAFRLELLTDPTLPLGGPGRSVLGTAALTEFKVQAAPADKPAQRAWVKFVKATADVNPPEAPLASIFDDKSKRRRVTGPVGYAIDGKDETAWGIDIGPGRRNQPRKAVFLADKPIRHPSGTVLTFHLTQNHGGWNSDDNQNHNLGRFRLALTTRPGAAADPLPAKVRALLAVPREKRTPAQKAAVFSYWRTTVPAWKEANDKIDALWRQHPEGTSQLVLRERDRPRDTHVLKRGDFLKPGQVVTPGVPAFLHPLPAGVPLDRLTFARWLVDRRAPTTARALVNRVWQTYFGAGLVATSEDLGTQSEPPSHPELLDWLAVEFMDRGWSLKQLHRLIVSSATYRQSSKVAPGLHAKDPFNRLLARGPRFRVEAEVVRDIALAASGLLNAKVGGRSVFPPLPAFLVVPPASYGPKIWPEDKGPERYRRALYTFRYRSVPYPVLQTFDAPNGDFACVRRARSNTPLQALLTLNEPVFLDCGRALALRALTDGGKGDADRLVYAFRRCLSRPPTADESAELLALLTKEREHFARPGAKPRELAATDAAQPPRLPAGAAPANLAAWTVVARVLLNLDETITKE